MLSRSTAEYQRCPLVLINQEQRYSMNLDRYVGRIVRLNQQVFRQIAKRAMSRGVALENCFLVSGVSSGMRKLICYGASFRIMVGVADVVLI